MHPKPDAGGSLGAGIVLGFLTMWDKAEGSGSSFASCVAAMATSASVADAMREFVAERVWRGKPVQSDETEAMTLRRRTLVSSQLMGLALTRYILRMPPVSTASPAEIAGWAGPTLDTYLFGPAALIRAAAPAVRQEAPLFSQVTVKFLFLVSAETESSCVDP